jgi:ABC-2 type transport system ATP-binding protein
MTVAADGQATGALHPDRVRSPYAIEIDGLSVWYGRTPAVRNLSMHVPHGSIYGLVGPNGSGKTTAMRTLATLQQPGEGTALVDSVDVRADPAEVRGRIGYLPDFSGVYESLTVDEYLNFVGGTYRIPARQRRQLIDELLELVDLADRRNHPVKWLSRGMRQQLGLARCLIHDPQILLLDEPAAGMDPQSRVDLREILRELHKLNKTILISSHVLSELAEVCTHIGILRGGELLAEGRVDETIGIASPAPRVRVGLLDAGSRDAALRLLEAHPMCREIVPESASTLLVGFAGGERDLAALLAQLVGAGVGVTEFGLEHPSLEDIFLQLTEIPEARA